MDIIKFKEEELAKSANDRDKTIKSVSSEIVKLNKLEETIKKMDIAEKVEPDIFEVLKKVSGRDVLIVSYEYGELEKYSIQPLDYSAKRILVDKCISIPVIGEDCIVSIVDAKTKEVIFDNPYYNENTAIQKAHLLGKKAALEDIDVQKSYERSRKQWADERHNDMIKAFEKAEGWFEEGKKYIYPQKEAEWQECVYHRASGLYCGIDLINALEIMKALDEGKEIKKVEKLISKVHSGASFGMLCSIVLHFSKRGPEFFRAESLDYKNAEGDEKEKYDKMLEEVETKNKRYEKELKDEGASK